MWSTFRTHASRSRDGVGHRRGRADDLHTLRSTAPSQGRAPVQYDSCAEHVASAAGGTAVLAVLLRASGRYRASRAGVVGECDAWCRQRPAAKRSGTPVGTELRRRCRTVTFRCSASAMARSAGTPATASTVPRWHRLVVPGRDAAPSTRASTNPSPRSARTHSGSTT